MTDPMTPQFWKDEEDELWAVIAALYIATFMSGVESGIEELPDELRPLVNVESFNNLAMNYARQYKYTLINRINDTTRTGAQRTIFEWMQDNTDKITLAALLLIIFSDARARTIARTEVTRIFALGNSAAWQAVGIKRVRWNTMKDERVCFPAWTQVSVKDGNKSIQDVCVGDLVWTRKGLRRVHAISSRKYRGKMTRVISGFGEVVSTADHPYWANGGWTEAGRLRTGDTVETLGNENGNIIGVSNFVIGNPNNIPAMLFQIGVFSPVSGGVSVPVCPVHLEGDTHGVDEKINRVSTEAGFLDVINPQIVKSVSNRLFKTCFGFGFPITRERTKLSIGVPGLYPNLFFASKAILDNWRASAVFRAVLWNPPVFSGAKGFTTTLTGAISNLYRSAFPTTNTVSVRNRSLHGKGFSAVRANLFNQKSSIVSLFALLGAKLSSGAGRRVVNLPSAGKAVDVFPGPLAFFYRKLKSLVCRWHGIRSLTNITVLYHRLFALPVTVYDIQVEEVPEFYANGFLVHNCPICAPRDGMVFGINDLSNYPPSHVNCRCWIEPIDERKGR